MFVATQVRQCRSAEHRGCAVGLTDGAPDGELVVGVLVEGQEVGAAEGALVGSLDGALLDDGCADGVAVVGTAVGTADAHRHSTARVRTVTGAPSVATHTPSSSK